VLTPDWEFQWGLSTVTDPGRDHVGVAPSTDWHTFGPSDANGVATVSISDLASSPKIWVREVLKDGFIPFTYDTTHPSNSNTVSAEFYCNTDVLMYDNYDFIQPPQLGNTYYCVAFKVANTPPPPPPANTKPVITVTAPNPTIVIQGDVFTDTGATAFDAEDGVINPSNIVATGTVNTSVVGTYIITYNVNDSQGLAADSQTRTVNVVLAPTECNDGLDNDGDGRVDYPADLGCDDIDDNDENDRPVITVTMPNPTIVTLGQVFLDLGATATDTEDGVINPNTISVSGTVDTGVVADYTVTYNVDDSQGLAALPKTRTVRVLPACSDTKNNDNDALTDYPDDLGCENPNDNDENDRPVITVLGSNPFNMTVNTTFTDPGATALDAEDGDLTTAIATTGTVNTSVIGTYTITYNVTDSGGLTAVSRTRTVNVNPAVTECNDGLDNDGDGTIDMADDGCDTPEDNDENSKPTITLIGSDPLEVQFGTVFAEP
jgi:hypothetical protein